MQNSRRDKIAVLYENQGDVSISQNLADKLGVALIKADKLIDNETAQVFLSWRAGCLMLLDNNAVDKPGILVDINHRPGEQLTWPIAKTGAFAQAIGKKTKTVADATAGWGQDSLALFRMGYAVTSIERSPIMAALLADGFNRLSQLDWCRQLNLSPPKLIQGDAIEIVGKLPEPPDCIYLDPMFPPKRKKSALAKKSIMVLRDLVGDDVDKEALFAAALKATGKRVVVKSPDYAEPLGGKPNESFHGKLLRYDVYLRKF